MHLKRQQISKTWPIQRKGTKYLVVPSHDKKSGIPLLIVLREILKTVKNKKEAKKILNLNLVKINNKIVKNEKYPLSLFDKLEVGDKIYQIKIDKNKKFSAEEVKNLESKIVKIINKKVLKNKIIQINLSDGRNFIAKDKANTGDSAVINLKENKIEKIIPLKEGSEVIITKGKHFGKTGKIKKIEEKTKLALVESDTKINVNLKNLMAI